MRIFIATAVGDDYCAKNHTSCRVGNKKNTNASGNKYAEKVPFIYLKYSCECTSGEFCEVFEWIMHMHATKRH